MFEPTSSFRVYWEGEHPKPKKCFYKGTFPNREKARHWCYHRRFALEGLTIVHPSGLEEPQVWEQDKTPRRGE